MTEREILSAVAEQIKLAKKFNKTKFSVREIDSFRMGCYAGVSIVFIHQMKSKKKKGKK